MDQKPSVGRIVHFGHAVYDNNRQDSPVFVKSFAAIITQVNADGTVNLTVFVPGSDPEPMGRLKFSPELKSGCWSWPPRV